MVLIDSNSTVLTIGDPLPPFSLLATDGLTIESAAIKDQVIVVVFTCNHCPYAQAVEDRLIELANKFDEEGVQFVLISSNDATDYPDDSFENMKKFSVAMLTLLLFAWGPRIHDPCIGIVR